MSEEYDVIVVGAGIMGAAAGWQLARRGLKTAVFEQFELGHVRGSSHGAARIFRFAYDKPDYVRLAQMALPLWRAAEEELGRELLLQSGGLDFGPPETLAPVARALDGAGAGYEMLSARELERRYPSYRLPAGCDALYQPQGGIVLADESRLGLIELARRHGAAVLERTRVERVLPDGNGVIVEGIGQAWRAGRVVLAAAGWTNDLLQPLGLTIPLTVTREQVAYFPPRDDAPFLPFIRHASSERFQVYGLPNGDGTIKLGEHGVGPEVHPDEESSVDEARIEPLITYIRDHLPGVVPEPVGAETCLYASSPDDDFVIDRYGPIVIGIGFGGHGFKFGAAIGSLLADLAAGTESPLPPRFASSRFAEAW